MVCGVGRVFGFGTAEVGCDSDGLFCSVSGFDVVFLWFDDRRVWTSFDRAFGRLETWSIVVDRA